MKALIQRVTRASVTVEGQRISEIGRGLCVLIGICDKDTEKDVEFISRKILNLRLFDNEGKRWAKSVKDLDMEIFCVSQFTLYAIIKKGAKPDFHRAMMGEQAKVLYENLLEKLRSEYDTSKIKDGAFGQMMEVEIINNGPVTIEIESSKSEENS